MAASDIPADAEVFMYNVALSYANTRVFWTNWTMGTSPPHIPQNPILCGGLVEFKFLSFSLDP